jgi:hypothetical protein
LAIYRAPNIDRRAFDADFTRSLWIDPEQHPGRRAASAAEQARDADDLACVEREIDAFRLARAAEATRFEKRDAARGAPAFDVREAARPAPDDMLDDLIQGQLAHRRSHNVMTVAKDRRVVR